MSDDELFIFKDAAKLADVSANALLDNLVSKNISLLYKPSSLLHLYCLSTDVSKTDPIFPFRGFLEDRRVVYKEINYFDYLVVDSITYENILRTKLIKLTLFKNIAHFNASNKISITSATDIALSQPDSTPTFPRAFKILSTSASFCFFESKSSDQIFMHGDKSTTSPPAFPHELNITIDDLWVISSDLKSLYPSIFKQMTENKENERLQIEKEPQEAIERNKNHEQVRDLNVAEDWMSDNLKILNQACIELFIVKDATDKCSDDRLKDEIKNFICDRYRQANKKEIKATALSMCIEIVFYERIIKNMLLPNTSNMCKYHKAITPPVVNINEFARNLKNNFIEEGLKWPPSKQAVKDKANEAEILPKRMNNQLVPFMLPKL